MLQRKEVAAIQRPHTYTSAERFIERVREAVLTDGRSYTVIAAKTNVAISTVHNIATGKTRWPRSTTLFPLLGVLGLEIHLIKNKGGAR